MSDTTINNTPLDSEKTLDLAITLWEASTAGERVQHLLSLLGANNVKAEFVVLPKLLGTEELRNAFINAVYSGN